MGDRTVGRTSDVITSRTNNATTGKISDGIIDSTTEKTENRTSDLMDDPTVILIIKKTIDELSSREFSPTRNSSVHSIGKTETMTINAKIGIGTETGIETALTTAEKTETEIETAGKSNKKREPITAPFSFLHTSLLHYCSW